MRWLAKLPADALFENNPIFKEFKGALAENYVLCELVALRNDTPYYWKSDNIAEVDFIIQLNTKIVPIEVKSSDNTRSKSLSSYRKKYEPELSIKLSMNSFISGDDVKNLPLYLTRKITSL